MNTMNTENMTDEEFFEVYRKFLWDWDINTRFIGWMKDMCQEPNYLQIIELGPRVVPILLLDLSWSRRFWYEALEKITGENPVPVNYRGNLPHMTEEWLNWGVENGNFKYIDYLDWCNRNNSLL